MRRWALDQGQEVILCCSSTRHRRFIDDLVSVMALPSGSRVRLRYGDDVCDSGVRSFGESGDDVPSGTIALITHVRFESDGTAQFLPLRIGAVVELRTEGSATYLEVELQDFVEPVDYVEFGRCLPSYASLELPHMPVGARKPIGYFCQRLKSTPALISSTDTLRWERIANNFLSAIDGSNADFPFLFRIEVVRRKRRQPIGMRNGIIVAPAVAELEIHVRTLANRSSFASIIQTSIGSLELQVDHPECRLSSGTRLPIDTTRNLLVAKMATSVSLRPAYGTITVTAKRNGDVTTGSRTPPEGSAEDSTPAPPGPVLEPVDQVIVELPILVGRPTSRVLAAALIASAVAMNAFEIDQWGEHAELVLFKVGLILVAALGALLLGMKPQGGG